MEVALDAEWDFDMLAGEMEDLLATGEIDMDLTGFTQYEIDGLLNQSGAGGGGTEIPAQYHVIVDCASEPAQLHLLKTLTEQGFKCRALLS